MSREERIFRETKNPIMASMKERVLSALNNTMYRLRTFLGSVAFLLLFTLGIGMGTWGAWGGGVSLD